LRAVEADNIGVKFYDATDKREPDHDDIADAVRSGQKLVNTAERLIALDECRHIAEVSASRWLNDAFVRHREAVNHDMLIAKEAIAVARSEFDQRLRLEREHLERQIGELRDEINALKAKQ
jgi:hypothetical protein